MPPTRIRTVKPDFYRHYDLYKAEVESGFPIRTAFSGLWCVCDRRGRFKWRPRQIKLDVLPYDDLEMEEVLEELVARGFVIKYTVGDETYGCVPTFEAHQFCNGKEPESSLPAPPEEEQTPHLEGLDEPESTREPRVGDTLATRDERESDASRTDEGQEGNGRGTELELRERDREVITNPPYPPKPDFEAWWTEFDRTFPRRGGGSEGRAPAKNLLGALFKSGKQDMAEVMAGCKRLRIWADHTGKSGTDEGVPSMVTWVKEQRWTEPHAITTGHVSGSKPSVNPDRRNPEKGTDFWEGPAETVWTDDWGAEKSEAWARANPDNAQSAKRIPRFWIRDGRQTNEPFDEEQWKAERMVAA